MNAHKRGSRSRWLRIKRRRTLRGVASLWRVSGLAVASRRERPRLVTTIVKLYRYNSTDIGLFLMSTHKS